MKKIFINIIYTIVLMVIPITVFSANNQGKINVAFKYDEEYVSNVNFNLYKLATYDSEGNLQVSSEFAKFSSDLQNLTVDNTNSLANDLSMYITSNSIKSYASKISSNKLLVFDNLEKGIYFILGDTLETVEGRYISQPVLVNIPSVIDNVETFEIIVEPKCEFIKWIDQIQVKKVWNDKNDKDKIRPKDITVELYADGVKVNSATLSSENNWEYVFKDIDMFVDGKKVDYTINEVNVKGYTSEITGDEEKGYTITNTHEVKKVLPGTENPTTLDNITKFLVIFISTFLLLISLIILSLKNKNKKTTTSY